MFGTLKYNGTSGDPYLIETTKPPFHTQDVGKHQTNACTMCREKKLKCTGDKTGCRRCRTKNTQCIYLGSAESKNGHSRKAVTGPAAASGRPVRLSQRSFPVNDEIAGPATSGLQKKRSLGHDDEGGTANGFDTSSSISGEKSNVKDRLPTSALTRSLENTDAPTGDTETDTFDFGDMSGTEACNSFPLPLGVENDLASLRNGFDPSGLLHDDVWMDDIPDQLQSDQLSTPLADWSPSLHTTSLNPAALQTRQATRPPTRQGYTGNIVNPPSRSSTSDADSHNYSDSTSNPSSTPQTCSCVATALKIAEQLKLYTNAKDSRSMTGLDTVRKVDGHFHYLKQAILRCSNMLDCKSCTGQSSVMMLILSICEKMLETCRQLSSAFLAPPSSPNASRRKSSMASSTGLSMISSSSDANNFNSLSEDGGSGTPMRVFGDAMLDTEDEASVVKVLVIARMKNLGNLLSRLEKLIRSNGWSGHGDVLDSIRSSYRRTAGAISSFEG